MGIRDPPWNPPRNAPLLRSAALLCGRLVLLPREPCAQLLGRVTQYPDVAAHRDVGEAHLQVTARVLFDGGEDPDGLAHLLRAGAGFREDGNGVGMAVVAEMAEIAGEIARADEEP